MSEKTEYSLLMRFTDQSKSFCHGYECGRIWEAMERKEPIDQNIHLANVEQFRLMAEIHGYQIDFEEYAPALDPGNTYRRMIGAPGNYTN